MTEATWGEGSKTLSINWRMSAALENVPRGDTEMAEVTNLERAVREWSELDAMHRDSAVLTPEHPIQLDGILHSSLAGAAIADLAAHLPSPPNVS